LSEGFSENTIRKLLASIFLLKSKPTISTIKEWNKPTNFYVGLSNDQVDLEDTGCTINEPVNDASSFSSISALNTDDSNGYKRVQNNYWGFDHENIMVFNTKDIIFPKAKKDWGSISSIIVSDEFINGNILFYKNLGGSFSVGEGKSFYIKKGNLRISFPKGCP